MLLLHLIPYKVFKYSVSFIILFLYRSAGSKYINRKEENKYLYVPNRALAEGGGVRLGDMSQIKSSLSIFTPSLMLL